MLDKPLRLYNTLTRQVEAVSSPQVRFYMCGMTVQDSPHMGHVRTFLMADVLRRTLRYLGYAVTYVQNFTDIDDKIIQRAHREGTDWRRVADRFIGEYLEVARALDFLPADVHPRAALHVQEIVELTQRLLAQGVAYATPDGVFFAVEKFPAYGKLSGKKLEDLIAGARVEPSPHKRNPLDFALWKARKEGEPYWHAPFGEGRPGWHIECSAMSTHYLGQPFEIHGGGTDLVFPHHENEIAQSEAAHGRPFAHLWFHVAMLQLSGEKMSKSTGLFFRARDVLEHHPPAAVRLYLLQHHYRTPMDYTEEGLQAARKAWDRVMRFVEDLPELSEGPVDSPALQAFEEALREDLNTPRAVGVMFATLDRAQQAFREGEIERGAAQARALLVMLDVLGLRVSRPGLEASARALVELLVEVRSELRKARAFALADRIRDRLKALGILLEDTPEGTRWRTVL